MCVILGIINKFDETFFFFVPSSYFYPANKHEMNNGSVRKTKRKENAV